MRKWVFGVIGVVALGGVAACVVAAQGGAGARPAAPTATADRPLITAEGIVVPERQARLAFKQAGRVTSVLVEVGKRVQAGEVLATLESTEANLAVRAAEDALRLAQTGLAQLTQPARPEEIANLQAGVAAAQARLAQARASTSPDELTARAQLESARVKLAELEAGPRPQDVTVAESQLAAARIKLEQLESGPRPEDVAAAAAQLRQAEARRTAAQAAAQGGDLAASQAGLASAQARLAQVRAGGRAEDVAAAQTAVDTAQTRLNQLTQGTPRLEDVRAAELEVDRARAALDQAVAARNEASTRGPAAGPEASRPELDRLDAGVKSAQIGVEVATNALSRARAGANAWEIRQAQLAVDQAKTSFEKLKAPTPFDVEQAQAAVDQAHASVEKLLQAVQTELDSSQAAVEIAQSTLDKLQAPAAFDVQTAREGVRQAEAQLDKVRNGTSSEVAAARAAYEQARASVDRIAATKPFELDAAQRAVDQARAQLALKQAGASQADLENTRARITQAETALAQARLGLDNLALVAPFAGVVTQVSLREGEQAAPATTAITLGNLDAFYVETRDLDEIGAAKVRVAQPVRITVNALEKTLPGKVAAIDLQATTTQTGDTNFTVKLTFDQPEPGLRWGQTVKVEFGR